MLSDPRLAGNCRRWQHRPLTEQHWAVPPGEALTCLGVSLTNATAQGSSARMGVRGTGSEARRCGHMMVHNHWGPLAGLSVLRALNPMETLHSTSPFHRTCG